MTVIGWTPRRRTEVAEGRNQSRCHSTPIIAPQPFGRMFVGEGKRSHQAQSALAHALN